MKMRTKTHNRVSFFTFSVSMENLFTVNEFDSGPIVIFLQQIGNFPLEEESQFLPWTFCHYSLIMIINGT